MLACDASTIVYCCGSFIDVSTRLASQAATVNSSRQLAEGLNGVVLDVILVPDEDETLFLTDKEGRQYVSGLVGDAVNAMAEGGNFRWRGIVVNPPDAAYNFVSLSLPGCPLHCARSPD